MKTLRITFILLAVLLFNSCGNSTVNGTQNNPPGTTPPTNTNTGNSTAGTWNTIDAIETALEKQTMSVKASTSYLYAYDEEEGSEMRYEFTALDSNTVDVETFETGDDQVYDSFVLKREDIIDSIFNRNSEYGRSRTIDMYPCRNSVLFSNNGQARPLRAVQLVHTLESGESLIHVISPDVPAYANPIATALSQSSNAWVFTAQSFETKRIVRVLGNEHLNIQCQ